MGINAGGSLEVAKAMVDSAYEAEEDFVLVDKLSELGKVEVPNAIEEIRSAEVRHDTVVDVVDMCAEVKRFLGI